jgi:hypothetical protein
MQDRIFNGFLARQFMEGTGLAAESDILALHAEPARPPQRYFARYRCRGLVKLDDGTIREADAFAVGIYFPPDYLRAAHPLRVLTFLSPRNIFHPNISDRAPVICIGRLTPGTGLVDLCYQIYEIVTYQKFTLRENDALNHAACAWARHNQHRFPIDARPLKRRAIHMHIELLAPARERQEDRT